MKESNYTSLKPRLTLEYNVSYFGLFHTTTSHKYVFLETV